MPPVYARTEAALAALAIIAILAVDHPSGRQTNGFDVVILGAQILDGSARPPYRADIGIRGGVIARIGDLSRIQATRAIAARGMYATPGFIDMHSHVDERFEESEGRVARNNLLQGITTAVVGHDGRSAWSSSETIADAVARWNRLGLAANAIPLVGHGSVRLAVMGDANRPPTTVELDRMKELVRQAMQGGASGLSTGLYYEPGKFAATEEIIALTREVKPFGGFYISHVRDEADQLRASVEELIRIGRETGVPVVHTHFKSANKPNFGKARSVLDRMANARRSGIQVWADIYPWTISSGGQNIDLSRLSKADAADADVETLARRIITPEMCVVVRATNSRYVGRRLSDVMKSMNASLIAAIQNLHRIGTRVDCIQMSEADIDGALRRDFVAISTDGDAPLSDGEHPRSYATYPRLIRDYVLRRGVVTLPHMIRAATGLPADIMGLTDRGYLREGQAADIVVFDSRRINYCASYLTPKCDSTGIDYMLVNGTMTLDHGSYTGALAGRGLLRGQIGPRPPVPIGERQGNHVEKNMGAYSFLSARIGSTLVARRAGR